MTEKLETPVIGNFSITLPAPNGAQLSVSGYLYGNESKESLDDRMDICRESLARQQRILEIPVLEEKMKMLAQTKADIEAAYVDLLERRKKKSSLTSQETASMSNYPTQIKTIEKELEKARTKIDEARKAA
ncbi:hypothetical protein CUJ91_04785 [Paraburkholderia graminis]|uniref:hypothetical protein n=1 Tax=Paraburkholderia graminis TaxID=60548 RepID=UPI000DEF4914|nr:hypothetical protein [Paraburkholderia graminis]AXF07313.1 hypothetical protein CUJ91_04785 [Paraburkholderia graminis]